MTAYGPPITVENLIARVRARADMTSSALVSDSEVADYLTDANAELHDLLITTYGEDYMVTCSDVTIAADAAYTEFAAIYTSTAPWRLVRIDRLQNGDRVPLRRFSLADTILDTTSRDWDSHPPRYDWRFTTLWFDPPPVAEESVRIYYVPYPQVFLDASTDSVLLYAHGHDRYLVISAAIQCLSKQEADVAPLMLERDRIERMIRSSAQPRDIGRPATVVDARGLDDDERLTFVARVNRFDYR